MYLSSHVVSKPANKVELFLINSQHQRVLDGDNNALEKPQLGTIRVLAPILFLIGLYSLGGSAVILIHGVVLNDLGVASKGYVTAKNIDGPNTRYVHFYLSYSYFADDNLIHSQYADVGGETYGAVNIGDQIDIHYWDGNPDDARLPDFNPDEYNSITGGIVFAIPCIGVAILGLFTAAMRLRRWQRLIRDGQLIEGQFIAVEYVRVTKRSGYYVMKYTFTSPSGKRRRGKARLNVKHPSIGDQIAVLYAHDHLYQAL